MSGGEVVLFWVLASIAVVGALGVVAARKAVYSALFLAMTMVSLAVMYMAQGAVFLGVGQIVVYTGAVMMLFLFVIMLLGVDTTEDISVEPLTAQRPLAAVAGAILAIGLGIVVTFGTISGARSMAAPNLKDVPNVEQVARIIFTDYLWAFEITSILLVIAVVGAVALARHRTDAFVDADPQRDDTVPTEEVTS